MFAKIVAFASVLAATTSAYPLFKQCGQAWSNDLMGSSGSNVCAKGCLMSSVSMVLADCGRQIGGATANPRTLNQWLSANGGYSGASLVWGSVGSLGLSFVTKTTSHTEIINYFKSGKAVVLNVNQGGHWVLMTGYSGSTYFVNDPGFAKTSYTQAEVVNSGIYSRPAGCASLLMSSPAAAEGFLSE